MKIKSKRIAIVVYGAVDVRTRKSARALASAGALVTVFSLSHIHVPFDNESFSVNYLSSTQLMRPYINWRPLRIAVNLTKNFFGRFIKQEAGPFGKNNVIKTLRAFRPEVIHAVNAETLAGVAEAALKLGVPYVYETYEFWPDHVFSKARKQTTELRIEMLVNERDHIANAAAVITVSPYLAREYSLVYELSKNPVVILNAPPTIAKEITAVHDPLRVIHLGGLSRQRNISVLLEAAVQCPQVVVTIQGNGPMEEEFRKFIDANNAENYVSVKEAVPYDDITAAAVEHDVGVICYKASDRQHDGALPNKFFEYLSGGLAILATNTAAFREFPGFNDFGQLIEVEQEGAMAAALAELSRDPEKVDRMKRAAFRAAQIYCGDAQAKKLIAVYEHIGK